MRAQNSGANEARREKQDRKAEAVEFWVSCRQHRGEYTEVKEMDTWLKQNYGQSIIYDRLKDIHAKYYPEKRLAPVTPVAPAPNGGVFLSMEFASDLKGQLDRVEKKIDDFIEYMTRP